MIEKIMKAVKSGNKKRGRNITVGAVVGMLLSCTVVMGAGRIGLEITNGDSGIKFSKDGIEFTPGNDKEDPYSENTWIQGKYTNNSLISGENSSGYAYAIRIENLELDNNFSFINNGAILGKGPSYTYGIFLKDISGNSSILENNGLISVESTNGYAYGISGEHINIETLKNNGLILSFGKNIVCGIMIKGRNPVIVTLENNGLILTNFTGIYYAATTSSIKTLTNNGSILGAVSGIEVGALFNGNAASIINRGMISTRDSKQEYNGIHMTQGVPSVNKLGILTNDGLISANRSDKSSGIRATGGGTVGNIISNGLVLSNGIGIRATGISKNMKNIENIANNGTISAEKYGIAADLTEKRSGYINKIVNTGVIYGKENAIKKVKGEKDDQGKGEGEIEEAVNYGILVTGSADVVDGLTNPLENYGLTIKNNGAEVTAGTPATGSADVIVGYKRAVNGEGTVTDTAIKRNLNIKNAEITDSSGTEGLTTGTGTKSFKFSGTEKEYDNSILNGMDDTLEISGADVNREVNGSIINAYGNAVIFKDAGKEFTLSGTIVNGGIKNKTVAIQGSDGADTLILQSGEVAYTGGETGSQNTIVNGDIDMGNGENSITLKTDTIVNGNITTGEGKDKLIIESGAVSNGNIVMGKGDDTLTIGSGAIINGTLNGGIAPSTPSPSILDAGVENNTLNFGTEGSSSKEETRVFYNISNFENMNINSNVTFYEKTTAADGTAKALEVTGAKEIKIGADGTLTLRIDATEKDSSGDSGKIVGHALYGNTGTITSEGGKLMLALNGAGNENIISFGDTTLGSGFNSKTLDTTSKLHTVERGDADNEVKVIVRWNLPDYLKYTQLNEIYHGILSVEDLIGNFNVDDDTKLLTFLGYLNDIYAGNPYSYSSELSRKSAGMFRDIVTENIFRPETNKWMIYGALTHVDGGTKDTYYGKGYYTTDIGSSDMDADTKITGAYMLGEYGVSNTLTSGVVIGGNKLKSDLSNGSKVDGSALYLGAYAKKYVGNLKVTAGLGFQYGDYDADRMAVNRVASDTEMSVMKYSNNYNDMTYDIYLNGRYSHNIGENLFLEPYATLSYTYIDQDGANEASKTLAIETDSKSFDYTVGKVGVDLKKVIPHEKGKSTLSAGVSYTKILDGADEEHITGRFKGGSDFDILVAHKNEHSIGVNAKYALELENGVIFDVKGTYSVERDSHNQSGKNRTKGEWIVGAGLGYKF